jgi:phage terminase small subunit
VLTAKEQRFIAEYLVDFNGAQAAQRAGWTARSAKVIASRLLTKPAIKAAIEAKRVKQIETTDLTAARVLEELRRLALSDIRALFDEHGNLRPLQQLTPEQASSIASVEVVIKNAKAGDGVTDTVHKIKLWDKPRRRSRCSRSTSRC